MGAKISVGYRQTTGVSTSTALKVSDIIRSSLYVNNVFDEGVHFVEIQAEAQNMRWTDDGNGDPTTSLGNLVTAGSTIVVERGRFANFRIIGAVANGILNVTAYRGG